MERLGSRSHLLGRSNGNVSNCTFTNNTGAGVEAPLKGTTDKDNAGLNEAIEYTATAVGTGSITSSIESAEVKVTVDKAGTELSVSDASTTYDVENELLITLKDMKGNALSGVKVTVDLNGAKTYTTDKTVKLKSLLEN